MWGKIWGKTLQSRLIRYNFFIICVIAVFVSVCSYITASKKTVEVAGNSLKNHVESIAYRYEMAYEEMLNIVLNCTERQTFNMSELSGGLTAAARKKGLDYAALIRDYCAITEYGSYIIKLSILDSQGTMVQTGTSFGSSDDGEKLLGSDWLEKELSKTMDYYQLDLVPVPFFQQKGYMLPIARTLTGNISQPGGWVVLCLSNQLFQDVLEETSEGQEAVVVTSEGKRVAALYEQEAHQAENDAVICSLRESGQEEGLIRRTLHGKDSLIAFKTYDRSGLMVYEAISLDTLSTDRMLITQTVIIMFASCLVFGLLLSVLMTHQVKKPIDRLVSHISAVAEGDFTRDPSIEGEDEIGQMGRVVNHMSAQIDTLMKQRLEDEKEKGDLELKMLQAQINPHFLYNTLDSIRWIAVIQKNSGIVKMVTALSGLLKNMAKGFNEKVTLKKELEFLNDYVTIEKVKYVELFDLEVEIEEEALYDALVIKLTLQPLVENAIFNGIEPGGKHGTIRIRAYSEEGCLYILVRDNGVGIPPEKLVSILHNTEKVKGNTMSGIGLPNVDRRIKLNYGEDYGLGIESRVGEYTQITVKMPLEYGTNE
ncbi:MAG: sensor histidine kinase [Clostridiales bacterium]|nr:sensor histidine kinase [Clostridiales bacterium]